MRNWQKRNRRKIVIGIMAAAVLLILLDCRRETLGQTKEVIQERQAATSESPEKEAREKALSEGGMPDDASSESSAGEASENDPQDAQKDDSQDASEDNAQKDDSQDIVLGFAGDLCLDESSLVMKHMRKKGKGIAGCIDPRLIQIMQSNDYTVINNEFAFSNRGRPMKGKMYTFCAPVRNTRILHKLGVDAVSLANNHVYDYGRTAFFDTLRALKKAKIAYTGGGKNRAEARKPVCFKCRGKKIAIVAATRAEKYIMTPEAGKNTPGVFRTYDDRGYVRAIRRAKKKADVVIAFVHWGTEYSTQLEKAQKQQARDYIDAGADVIVGAHTHCLQGIGYYKKKPIFYSLGNFWFNEKRLYTTLLQLTIRQDGSVKARMLPCLQSKRETRLLTGKKQVRKFVKHVNRISTNGRLDKQGNCFQRSKK